MIEILKAILLGIVEGITEWLPISSTGHMILVEEFVKLQVTPQFKSFFFVAIQLGAVLAVVAYFARSILARPFRSNLDLFAKIVLACLPAAVVGIIFDDYIDALFYNYITVSIMLILFGVILMVVDRGGDDKINSDLSTITYMDSLVIGLFQLIAAIFPGTSRSGATIAGGLIRGLSRKTAAEFTFLMSVPVMAGASLLKLIKMDMSPTSGELMVLLSGSFVAFLVSLASISFLMQFVKTKGMRVFGYYRIILGILVLAYFFGGSFV